MTATFVNSWLRWILTGRAVEVDGWNLKHFGGRSTPPLSHLWTSGYQLVPRQIGKENARQRSVRTRVQAIVLVLITTTVDYGLYSLLLKTLVDIVQTEEDRLSDMALTDQTMAHLHSFNLSSYEDIDDDDSLYEVALTWLHDVTQVGGDDESYQNVAMHRTMGQGWLLLLLYSTGLLAHLPLLQHSLLIHSSSTFAGSLSTASSLVLNRLRSPTALRSPTNHRLHRARRRSGCPTTLFNSPSTSSRMPSSGRALAWSMR